jgi:hypothetical protein
MSITPETGPWTEADYGGSEYERLAEFPPKKELDQGLAHLVVRYLEDAVEQNLLEKEPDTPFRIAELGAGRAPISTILNSQEAECDAFDINPDMKGRGELTHVNEYNDHFDLTTPDLDPKYIGKYDCVTMENCLYATSISEDGTKQYTKEEAEILREIALRKAMMMLKPGGVLVMSDALNNTSNFGLKRILTFLDRDVLARQNFHEHEKNQIGIVIEYLREHMDKSNPKASMLDILESNKEFISKAQLFTHAENLDLFRNIYTGSQLLYSDPEDYLGSNGTYVIQKGLEENTRELGEPTELRYPIHKRLLEIIGKFRRKVYKDTNATDNLPIIDKYDTKEATGITLVYPNKNGLGFLAAATLQERGEMGLDAEELMIPIDASKNFQSALLEFIYKDSALVRQALRNGISQINIGEVRRLAADKLSIEQLKYFISDLWKRLTPFCRDNNIHIVLFVSDEKRLRLFNYVNGKKGTQFRKVEGFKLNKSSEEIQTMMISASNYFFGEWDKLIEENILTEEDVENINTLREEINNGDNWSEVVKSLNNSDQITQSVQKLLNNPPDNVNLYYTDHPLLD